MRRTKSVPFFFWGGEAPRTVTRSRRITAPYKTSRVIIIISSSSSSISLLFYYHFNYTLQLKYTRAVFGVQIRDYPNFKFNSSFTRKYTSSMAVRIYAHLNGGASITTCARVVAAGFCAVCCWQPSGDGRHAHAVSIARLSTDTHTHTYTHRQTHA